MEDNLQDPSLTGVSSGRKANMGSTPIPQLFIIHPYTLDKSAKYVQRKGGVCE
jgi:hypothetical protein